MARIIVIVLHFLGSAFFIIWGLFCFVDLPELRALGLPVWYCALMFPFAPACLLLAILSLKRAAHFKSTWRAFLYLPVRIVTFLSAFIFLWEPRLEIEESLADSTFAMQSDVDFSSAILGWIFFGVTIWLTLANKETPASTDYLTPAGKDTSTSTDSLTLAGKDKFTKRLANQQDGRYVIDPRDFRRDRVLIGIMVVFWLIWAPATAVVTYLAITDPKPFFFLWLVGGYLGTIIIPVSLFRMNKKQVLEVAGDTLVVDTLAIIPPFKVRIDKLDLQALTLERYQGHSRHGDTVFTLNLIRKGSLWPKRISLAHYVKLEDQAIIFEEIKEFLQKNGFVFDTKNESTGLSVFNKVSGRWVIGG
jgi:hypothetical protein